MLLAHYYELCITLIIIAFHINDFSEASRTCRAILHFSEKFNR